MRYYDTNEEVRFYLQNEEISAPLMYVYELIKLFFTFQEFWSDLESEVIRVYRKNICFLHDKNNCIQRLKMP